jgi:hypothetical protein
MPSACAFVSGSSRHSTGSKQLRSKRRPASGHGSVAWAFTFAATARALVRLSKLIAEAPDLMATVPGFAKDFVGRWRQGKSDGESLLGLSRASWTCTTDRPAPGCHPAESSLGGKLLNASGAAATNLSKQRNAALSRARAAEYPHPGILSLRYGPSHCDERLAHEHDIGRRA